MAPASLADLKATIVRYRARVGKTPYARHVISLVLAQIANVYGKAEARRALRDCGLSS